MRWDFSDQLRMTRRQAVDAATSTARARRRAHLVRLRRRRPAGAQGDRAAPAAPVKDERIYLGGFEIYRRARASTPARARDAARHGRHAAHRAGRDAHAGAASRACPAQLVRYQFGNHLGSASLELDDAGADHLLRGVLAVRRDAPTRPCAARSRRRSATATPARSATRRPGSAIHGARYYAPWLGRWTSCDPAASLDGPNLYAYCRCSRSTSSTRPVSRGERVGGLDLDGKVTSTSTGELKRVKSRRPAVPDGCGTAGMPLDRVDQDPHGDPDEQGAQGQSARSPVSNEELRRHETQEPPRRRFKVLRGVGAPPGATPGRQVTRSFIQPSTPSTSSVRSART